MVPVLAFAPFPVVNMAVDEHTLGEVHIIGPFIEVPPECRIQHRPQMIDASALLFRQKHGDPSQEPSLFGKTHFDGDLFCNDGIALLLSSRISGYCRQGISDVEELADVSMHPKGKPEGFLITVLIAQPIHRLEILYDGSQESASFSDGFLEFVFCFRHNLHLL